MESQQPALPASISALLTRASFPTNWNARLKQLLQHVQTTNDLTVAVPFSIAVATPVDNDVTAAVIVSDAQEANRTDACWLVKEDYVGPPKASMCQAKPFLSDEADDAWYVDSALMQALQHTDSAPTLAFAPIRVSSSLGYMLIWRTNTSIRLVDGNRVTVDWLPEMLVKRNTVQRSARLALLSKCGVLVFANISERDMHEQVLQTYSVVGLPGCEDEDAYEIQKRRDPQSQEIRTSQRAVTDTLNSLSSKLSDSNIVLRMYSDVDLLQPNSLIQQSGGDECNRQPMPNNIQYERCENALESQVAYTISHIHNYAALPSTLLAVNQFPYEAAIIRKDLLPQTVRRGCRNRLDSHTNENIDRTITDNNTRESPGLPSWWLPCFDLTTELPQFYSFLQRQEMCSKVPTINAPAVSSVADDDVQKEMAKCSVNSNKNNNSVVVPTTGLWAVKLAQGSRSAGVVVASDLARIVQSMAAPGGDRVAQQYASAPVLLNGKKFDLRTYVMVHSFEPKLIAYMYTNYYARVSGAAFSLAEDSLDKYDVHLTVGKYNKDKAAGQEHRMLSRAQMLEMLGGDVVAADYCDDADNKSKQERNIGDQCTAKEWEEIVEPQVLTMLRELLQGAAPQIGEWPKSRGMYGVDWICERMLGGVESNEGLVPRLIEVNFAPDVSTITSLDSSFAQSALRVLFGEESLRLDGSLDVGGVASALGVVPIHVTQK